MPLELELAFHEEVLGGKQRFLVGRESHLRLPDIVRAHHAHFHPPLVLAHVPLVHFDRLLAHLNEGNPELHLVVGGEDGLDRRDDFPFPGQLCNLLGFAGNADFSHVCGRAEIAKQRLIDGEPGKGVVFGTEYFVSRILTDSIAISVREPIRAKPQIVMGAERGLSIQSALVVIILLGIDLKLSRLIFSQTDDFALGGCPGENRIHVISGQQGSLALHDLGSPVGLAQSRQVERRVEYPPGIADPIGIDFQVGPIPADVEIVGQRHCNSALQRQDLGAFGLENLRRRRRYPANADQQCEDKGEASDECRFVSKNKQWEKLPGNTHELKPVVEAHQV